MSGSTFHRGYYYPLDVKRALDPNRSRRYVAACVRRALRTPDSARNAQRKRAARALERSGRELRDGATQPHARAP